MAVHDTPTPQPLRDAVHLESVGYLEAPDGRERFDPVALAVDARNRILVADRSRGAVFLYEGPGRPAGWFADPPPTIGSSRFLDVRAIVTTSGLLAHVLDAGTGFVYSYDLSGQFRGTALNLAGSITFGRFGRIRASGMALDPTGRPCLTDTEGDRILVFDPQWGPSHEIGGPGTTQGGFRDPAAIAIGPQGRIFVADRGNRLVQIFDPLGGFLEEVPFPHTPESIVADRNGNVFVGDAAGVVTVLAPGRRIAEFSPGRGAGPAFLAVSSDGSRLYVSRPARGHVEILAIEPPGGGP